MGFFDKKPTASQETVSSTTESNSGRTRRKRHKNDSTNNGNSNKWELSLQLTPMSEQLPPDTKEQILVWEKEWGYDVQAAALVKQHVEMDIQMFGFPRVTHWAKLGVDG